MARMPSKQAQVSVPQESLAQLAFALLAGLFFFVTIIKLGDPVILENVITPPTNLSDAYYESWPPKWGFWMVIPLIIAGVLAIPWNRLKFRWMLALPAVWLAWEFVAAASSEGPDLTGQTMAHFTVCVALFYLGCFVLRGFSRLWPIWTGISLALCWVIHAGIEQHFGGLDATRKLINSGSNPLGLSPEALNNPDFIKRIASNRIYSTFVYANAFAGGLVLMMPLALVFLWQLTPKVRFPMRVGMVVILGGTGLACLYWSGSKAGWLVALTVGLVALWHSALPLKWKRMLICGVLILGVAAFAIKYAAFFKKERNSVGARFAYWRAALIVIREHPWLGTGPGTFQIPYKQLKRPDDEATKLCHNDYLEQATDSGILGFIAYSAMILVILYSLYRYSAVKKAGHWMTFSIWLGVFGLCLHSLVEFHLYIPALSWTAFFLMGCLASRLD
jgi:hypothetical protein